ncbi:MAG TPA: DUF4097 family beta strand repeat-containing protein [Terriglobales bacterium]|jgi:hypothetical protein|nr:DUF4097 family beta strand repeat-containing protein [Terriglobales bacterium]
MRSGQRAAKIVAVAIVAAVGLAAGPVRKEYRYTVGSRATVTITNQYGPISVRPASGSQVLVTATTYSDKVEVDQGQSGNRVDVLSHLLPGATADNGRVEYEVQVPPDASVNLHSTTGPLHAEQLHGDVTLEGATARVEARDIRDAHVHVRTLNGPVTLTNIHNGHVEITSVSGDVTLNSVDGPFVQVNSSSGKIRYDGDFGAAGEYFLTSHSGDIEATAPGDASIDVIARSIRGHVENDFPLQPRHTPFVVKAGSAFAGTVGRAGSAVKLLSFSGKIHLKKR